MFFFSVSFNFPCNLTKCRLGDFGVAFITYFLISNVIYIQGVTGGTDQTSGGCSLC